MTNLEHHYKDRDPKETIKIIKKFFSDRGYDIFKKVNTITKAGTYCSIFELYYNNIKILMTNGKGMTEDYNIASGLGELYERFCFYALENNFVHKKIEDVYKNSDYQLISKEDFINDKQTEAYLKTILPEYNEYYINKFIENFYQNKIYGKKFINLKDSNDIIYKNEHMIFATNGSTGLSAGNTLEEALVQAISEFYERLVNSYFFKNINSLNYQYYKINNDILPKNLQNIIIQAEKNDNCKISLYDLSYTYNLPVILVLFQDLKYHTFYYDFGSSPIFEIAVERCLTEVYQGFYSHSQIVKEITYPEETRWEFIVSKQNRTHATDLMFIPEALLFNCKSIDNFNDKIFLPKGSYSNQNLLNHIKYLNQINNLEIYYSDISLCPDMYAVHIISKEYMNKTSLIRQELWASQYTEFELICLFEINNKIQKVFNEIIDNGLKDITDEEIENFFESIKFIAQPIFEKFGTNEGIQRILRSFNNLHNDIYNIYTAAYTIPEYSYYNNLLIWNIYNNKFKIDKVNENLIIYPQIQIWIILKKYIEENFPKEKIQKILQLFNFESLDIDNIEINNMFIIKKIIDYLYNEYHSLQYYNFIKTLQKNKEDSN